MRLADFISSNVEPILVEWEAFARTASPGKTMDKLALRDHAADILRATARDMMTSQVMTQQADKSQGHGDGGKESARLDGASEVHAADRVDSGFDLMEVVAEYRALRASVIRLWRESAPDQNARDLEDLTRFNESIDQSLTKAVSSYTHRVDRSRQMFLAILSHDLRGPLNAVKLSAEVLVSSRLDAGSLLTARQISTSASAMAAMIGDLLDFTCGGLGTVMPLMPAAMDLRTICREVINEMKAVHPTHELGFRAEGDLTGEWDPTRLRQVISNLLGNAVQHGADSGPVDLFACADAASVKLEVRNGGPPISADLLPTIFDPLVRESSPDVEKKRPAGSIGLGLYIAREVVAAHGGTIEVKSSDAGGTVFTVQLPRRHGAHQPPIPHI